MTDVLIRNLSDEVIAAIDQKADEQGLTRDEFLRRQVSENAVRDDSNLPELTDEDMRLFSETFKDARNPEIMRKVWQ